LRASPEAGIPAATMNAATMRPVLTRLPDHTLRLVHDEIAYAPIAGDAALGALLFTLSADDVDLAAARAADRPELRLSLAAARQYARILARHAERAARGEPLLPAGMTEATARGWLAAAAAAVPAAEQERFCWRVARQLGPEPWSDGHPAIELHPQQFPLFEASFEETEDTPRDEAAPAASQPGDDAVAIDDAATAASQPIDDTAAPDAAAIPPGADD
jgi:hypothetical protein